MLLFVLQKIFEIVETGIGEKITDMGMFSAVTDTLHCEASTLHHPDVSQAHSIQHAAACT